MVLFNLFIFIVYFFKYIAWYDKFLMIFNINASFSW